MAKQRVHPTAQERELHHARCKSWQNREYIQLSHGALRVQPRCKSWQNREYIQLQDFTAGVSQAVSHGKTESTSNTTTPAN